MTFLWLYRVLKISLQVCCISCNFFFNKGNYGMFFLLVIHSRNVLLTITDSTYLIMFLSKFYSELLQYRVSFKNKQTFGKFVVLLPKTPRNFCQNLKNHQTYVQRLQIATKPIKWRKKQMLLTIQCNLTYPVYL